MPPKKKKRQPAPRRRPLSIKIVGDDISIDAKFGNARLGHLVEDIAAHFSEKIGTSPVVGAPPEHDFDVVKRVIEHAEPAVLKAILDLAKSELDLRANAS